MKFLKAIGIGLLTTLLIFAGMIVVANIVAFLKTFVGPFFAILGGLLFVLFVCISIAVYNDL